MLEEEPRLSPAALHGAFGHVAKRCDLGECVAAEKMQVDELRQFRLDRGEFVKHVSQSLELLSQLHGAGGRRFVAGERDLELPATLCRLTAPAEVDDEMTHRARRVGEKSH